HGVRWGCLRVEADGLLARGDRPVQVTLVRECAAEVNPDGYVLGSQRAGSLVGTDLPAVLAVVAMPQTEGEGQFKVRGVLGASSRQQRGRVQSVALHQLGEHTQGGGRGGAEV